MPQKIADTVARKLLDQDGYLKSLPAAKYDEIPFSDLRLFCHFYARYGLPTLELINWLKDYIGERSVIEIGSGCGDLGRLLNVRMTDNFCQNWPDVALMYDLGQQPRIKYGENIENLDALDAVKKYKPQIVIGQWVTNWIDPNLPPPEGGGSMYGIKEDLLLQECQTYIMIGSRMIHGHKPILQLPHHELHLPFLRSRSKSKESNVVYIWEK